MTTAQYLQALAALGLEPRSAETADALGVSRRSAYYYAAGAFIPLPVAIILRLRLEAARKTVGEFPMWPVSDSGQTGI